MDGNLLTPAGPIHINCPSDGVEGDDGNMHESFNMSFEDDEDAFPHHEEEHVVLDMDPTKRYIKYDRPLRYSRYKQTYKAFDNEDGIEVCWNEVSPDDTNLANSKESQRWQAATLQGLELLKGFAHPNIVQVVNYWLSDDGDQRHIIYMTEVLSSGTLKNYLSNAKMLKTKIVKKWCTHILTGLAYLHSQSPPICHGDIKCDNIFISGHSGQVKLGDPFHSLFQRGRSGIGQAEFMAPELQSDDHDHRADIYAFGVCVLEMVTMETPYSECDNRGEVFLKVSKGLLPNCLSKVRHRLGRKFIEQCLMPVNFRATAEELLEDPFLAEAEDDSRNVSEAILGLEPLTPQRQGSVPPLQGHLKDAAPVSPRSPGRTRVVDVAASGDDKVDEACSSDSLFTIDSASTKKEPRVLDLVGRLHVNGIVKQLNTEFRLDEDTCCEVAGELVDTFRGECPRLDAKAVSREIERAVMASDYSSVGSPRMSEGPRRSTLSDDLGDLTTKCPNVDLREEVALYKELDELVIRQEREMQELERNHRQQSNELLAKMAQVGLKTAPIGGVRQPLSNDALIDRSCSGDKPTTSHDILQAMRLFPECGFEESDVRQASGTQEIQQRPASMPQEGFTDLPLSSRQTSV